MDWKENFLKACRYEMHKLVLQNPLFRLIFCNMTSSLSHVPIHKQCANLTFPQFLL